jgi:tetratricopeptide (TPR) repeat protein
MTEPLRTAPGSDGSADADRDALIERLLLAGLDHYFEGRYEEAVNVWTRVAFLERGHGRARAYIERARGALAERQRESDELLHRGLDAYRTGDLAGARDLLTRAVANGSSETALVFLERLGIAEAGQAAAASRSIAGDAGPLFGRTPQRRHSDRSPNAASTNWIATILACVVVAGAILLAAQPIASWLGDGPAVAPMASPRATDPLPVVRAAEMRVARAKALYESGRPYDALRLLEAIDRGDPLRGDADALTATIQTALLATVPSRAVPASTAPTLQTAGEAVR